MPTTKYDGRGVFGKITSGDIGAIDGGDVATVGKAAIDVAHLAGKAMPEPVGVAINGVSSYYNKEKTAQQISEYFDVSSIRQLVRKNPALRTKLEKKEEFDWWDFGGQTVSSMGGAAAGGVGATLLATAFFPPALPVALVAGSLTGGYAGNSLYKAGFEKQEQDPIIINMQISKMHADGGYVPPEVVFAALAANLPEKTGRGVDRILAKYTGTGLFTEALSDPNNMKKLSAMMNNPVIDDAIRAQTGMLRDPQNPFKTVAEQYAEMINNGQMKPQSMLNPGEGMYVMSAIAQGQKYNVDVPITPETRQRSLSREI
jgi:hypothetical protein